MLTDEIRGTLDFLRSAEKLKDVLRTGHTSGGRPESTAEHTWRLCLMAIVFAEGFGDIDIAKLLKICIIHDLGEALSGDIPAVAQTADNSKAERERGDLEVLTRTLPPRQRAEILTLWEEYESAATTEAILAKGLDKLETILQHSQGRNPSDFDYGFNLTYGLSQTSAHPLLKQIRSLLDAETQARAAERQPP